MKDNKLWGLFWFVALLVLVSSLLGMRDPEFVQLYEISYQADDIVFKDASSRVAIEKLSDGTYMVIWPVPSSGEEKLVATMRIEGSWDTLMKVQHTILHGDPTVFYGGRPLEQLPVKKTDD